MLAVLRTSMLLSIWCQGRCKTRDLCVESRKALWKLEPSNWVVNYAYSKSSESPEMSRGLGNLLYTASPIGYQGLPYPEYSSRLLAER